MKVRAISPFATIFFMGVLVCLGVLFLLSTFVLSKTFPAPFAWTMFLSPTGAAIGVLGGVGIGLIYGAVSLAPDAKPWTLFQCIDRSAFHIP